MDGVFTRLDLGSGIFGTAFCGESLDASGARAPFSVL